MKKLVLAAGLSLLSVQAVQAQFQLSVGPRVGLRATTLSKDTYVGEVKQRLGGQLGVAANAQFKRFAIQPALLFSQQNVHINYRRGDDNHYLTLQDDLRLKYLELPVTFVFTPGKSQGVQLLAGAYIARSIGGRRSGIFTRHFNDPLDTSSKYDHRSSPFGDWDAGLNAGVGYKKGPLQVQATYSLGLHNIDPANRAYFLSLDIVRENREPYYRSVQLNLTYFFALNK